MKNVISQLSVRIQILCSSVLTLLLISAFIFIYYPQKEKEQLEKIMQYKDQSIAEMIALGVGMGMESSNFDLILEAIDWAKRDSALSFVFVLDEKKEMFASYNPSNYKLNVQGLTEQHNVVELLDKPHHVVLVPIKYMDKNHGTLILATSLEGLYSKISNRTLTTFFISLAILLAGILLSLFFSKLITSPLHKLRIAAGKIASGNYDINIEVESKNEIGVLGKSFNEMANKIKHFITQMEKEIKERKRAEENYRGLYENSMLGIYRSKPDGSIIMANPAAKKILGLQHEETFLSINVENHYFDPADRKKFQEIVEAEGTIYDFEAKWKKPNGAVIDLRESARAVGDEYGKITYYEGIVEDITESKKAADAVHRARLEAEKAARIKADFLANMSHEIRTPMNGVIGMTGLLLDTELNAEQKDYVETIRLSGDALLTIINDILDFSKIESGNLLLEMQSFYLRDPIEESFDFLASKAALKNLEMAYDFENNVPEVISGDITRLRQILINLLSNAVKFTEVGEIAVSINAEETEDGKYKIHFAVRDTGIGIPKDRIDKLFKSFSQVDTSTTRRFGGTGLGLAISKRLCEIMGGTMWVESELGKGSVFNFTILAESGEKPQREYLVDPSPILKGKKVLIVDDYAASRKLISIQTDFWDMNPVEVSSGFEAMELIRAKNHFDLAILDMHMPGMDGVTLASEIRKYRSRAELPLIMLTSLGKRKEDEKYISEYFSAYLVKPIKQSLLYNKIVSVFNTERKNNKSEGEEMQFDTKMAENYPLRILLADDNVINQKVAERMLQKMGYRMDIVSNGLEILQALEQAPYDIIFIDVHMPEMDGLEATRRICDKSSKDNRPLLVAMTADAMQGDREKCFEAGMDDYISKPVKIPEIVKALERASSLQLEEKRKG